MTPLPSNTFGMTVNQALIRQHYSLASLLFVYLNGRLKYIVKRPKPEDSSTLLPALSHDFWLNVWPINNEKSLTYLSMSPLFCVDMLKWIMVDSILKVSILVLILKVLVFSKVCLGTQTVSRLLSFLCDVQLFALCVPIFFTV